MCIIFNFVYSQVETNKVFLRDTTIISPFSILLFGGSINIQHQTGQVTIDGWLKLMAPAQTAVLFKELRSTLHTILQEMIRNPESSRTILKYHVDYAIRTLQHNVFVFTSGLMCNSFYFLVQNSTIVNNEVVKSMIHLLLEEDKPQK
ncbi:hypothetical protein JRO89_XS02G0227800 [Xanthoceras sorbifolium]|uniref:RNA helicase C-terminal domain-containing protein n=1 Tax=Xanthoceras sorbifolium TaxID=99658 RepID=A0ABQ8IH55_9ROSI|nr:hypothetical protein JRO89_XS02G0227800 [Xanthoceras sorbifolium]